MPTPEHHEWVQNALGVDVRKYGAMPGGNSGESSEAAAAPGGEAGPAKLATEVEVLALKLIDHPTKYGAIKITGTLKASTTTSGKEEVGKTYTANDAKKRESGV